ncbi:metallo-beta-lactamase class B [Roseimicrobium gellanilyticum]|uniref:Metallo-beta-lactamase class B n=2 Tax=Roseimicrobium gellanilyticum TaxID=748857 RepID=A0A366HTI0_9BACT|nr:subclass B3 metallo-beta-lactamase [Roseimicrobium gellanilyticum]RBP47591.1 metallo-beta-lactamase class B [Roseimicrobium gellanilyticum]
MTRSLFLSGMLALCLSTTITSTANAQNTAEWSEPFPPHKVAGNLYYVGSKGLATYLVTTPEGHVLINSNLEDSLPLIQKNVEQLGFKFSDVKILLISHAHWDHCAGSASIIKATGAKYMVMEQDVAVVESGNAPKKSRLKPAYLGFPTAKVDRVLKDGDEVKLGGATLVAHLTPGHTPGCTTWTLQVEENGKKLDAVIIGSPNVNPGYVLVNNKDYPGIATDYEKTFRVLKSLPVDLFLGAHGSYYDMEAKVKNLEGAATNPFIDKEGYKRYVEDREQAFLKEWEKQKAAKK